MLRIRMWWLGAFVIASLASALFARQGVLTTRDGQILTGDIEAGPDGKSVNITVHGATLSISKDIVTEIDYADQAQNDFSQKLAALDPDDITGRLRLSRFELAARQYDLAATAAKDAERIDPHNPDAVILLDTIQSQRLLDEKAVTTPPTDAGAAAPAAPGSPAAITPPVSYLTMDDVYAIRRAELRPDDVVRVDFFNDVRRRYLGPQADSKFNAESQTQQAIDIIQTGILSLARDVRPFNDPMVLQEFRKKVQPRIIAGCAASGCHSDGAGGFFLYRDATETLPAYTNFYILQQTGRTLEGGDTFGNGPVYRPMIDRVRPQSSLILQFGLPRDMAATPHPDVPGFKGIYVGLNDQVYLEISRWISSMAPMTPNYGIKFDIPTGSPTTRGS
jgi:hypothetical protein